MNYRKIHYTEDYSRFSLIKINREVNPNSTKAKKLVKLMRQHGFNPAHPIIVRGNREGNYDVLDGQHRLYFARKLGTGAWYTFDPTQMSVSDHNKASNDWDTGTYIRSWYKDGKEDFQEVVEFSDRYGINLATSAGLLAGTATASNVRDRVESGTYEVKSRKIATSVAECLEAVKETEHVTNNSSALKAIYALHFVDYFEPRELIKKIESNPGLLVNYGDRDSFLDMFQEIYNHRRRTKYPLAFDARQAMEDRNAVSRN